MPASLDPEKVAAFIASAPDTETAALYSKLVSPVVAVQVTYPAFLAALDRSIESAQPSLDAAPYAVLFDYKPHSSRRWAYHLAQEVLSTEPAQASYFHSAAESKTKALEKLLESGIRHFVIIDDAAYSGTQIGNTIKQVTEWAKSYGVEDIHFTVIVPFATTEAKNLLAEFKSTLVCSDQHMPALAECLTDEEKALAIDRKVLIPREIVTDEPSFSIATTSFAHRVADPYSYSSDLGSLMTEWRKPYAYSDENEYAIAERAAFNEFWAPVTHSSER